VDAFPAWIEPADDELGTGPFPDVDGSAFVLATTE